MNARIFAAASIVAVLVGFLAWTQTTRTEPGFIAVVRNGGPLDDKDIRQIVPPASGITWTGWWSTAREYPATERFYDIVPGDFGASPAAGDTINADAYRTDTKDGVNVGIVGQVKFALNTDDAVLRDFDTRFGARTFAVPNDPDGRRLSPADGDEGFGTWLATQARPVVQETFRQQVGSYDCAQLVASCALLRGNGQPINPAQLVNGEGNAQVFAEIGQKINAALATNINAQLGGPFLRDIRVVFTQVDLPPSVKQAIGDAQTAFAKTTQAQAQAASDKAAAEGRAATALADAQANKNRQDGYNACPTCADIDRIKAQGDALSKLPSGVTVYAPGNDNVQVPVR